MSVWYFNCKDYETPVCCTALLWRWSRDRQFPGGLAKASREMDLENSITEAQKSTYAWENDMLTFQKDLQSLSSLSGSRWKALHSHAKHVNLHVQFLYDQTPLQKVTLFSIILVNLR